MLGNATQDINLEHAGIVLREEFMEAHGLSVRALASAIGVPANRIHGIVHGIRGITADTDLRLAKFFGLSEGYFLRIQENYEILAAKRKINGDLKKIVPLLALKCT
jgi:addiction module HigA family antidote